MRRLAPAIALALFVTACGGDGQPIFESGSTVPGGGTGETGSTGAGAIVTTTIPAPIEDADLLLDAVSGTPGPAPAVGTPDVELADAIRADLIAGGADLAGVGVWVLPITGTDERMIVFTVEASAEQLNEDGGTDFFGDLDALPSLEGVTDITRFTFHYYDSDDEGDFVLTMTVPLEEITATEGETDPEAVAIQLQRLP